MTLTTTATELPRLMRCIGSRLMEPALPGGGNREQRDEGNAAHWLAEQFFNGNMVKAGQKALNGYVITDDMIEHVETYVSALDCGEMETDTSFAGNGWEVHGRADHLVYRADANTLTVDDFKYGWRIVEPDENWTLVAHAVGWCLKHGIAPDKITLRIHQPRPYHSDGPTREWSCTFAQLMGYYEQIERRLSNPTDELTTGLEQCAKCHALANCPAARRACMNAIDASMLAFDDSLPKDVIAFEYETLDQALGMIEARRDAVKELMTHRIKQGEVFHGYILDERYGNRKWKAGLTAAALSMATGKDLAKDGIVTPAAAERMGVPAEVVASLVDRPRIDPKLKKIDADARARQTFGKPEGA